MNVDSFIARWFREHVYPVAADLLLALSSPGSEVCIGLAVTMAALFLLWKRAWYALLTLMLVVPGGTLLGELLKLAVQRIRPFVEGPQGPWGGYSFPSSHTLAATLLYGLVALCVLRIPRCQPWRACSCVAAGAVVIGVGFSRVALGAHYLSDVMASLVLGTGWLVLCVTLVGALQRRRIRVAAVVLSCPTPELPLNTAIEQSS